ncbi:MAG: hypothetical protein K0B52_05500, partial [FCB group bacterium]|nr:hypothetical protein [FCB group bacterium]
MLNPGIIPSSEPSIRVGIVLPHDGQKKISTFFSNMCDYEMAVDALTFSTCEVAGILFKVEENAIRFSINGKEYKDVHKIVFRPTSEKAHIT